MRQVADKVQAAVSFSEDDYLKPSKVELTNEQTGDTFSIDSSGQISKIQQISSEPIASNVMDQTLFVKEKFNVSHEAYHEMARVNPTMPWLNKLFKKTKALNATFNIKSVPGTLQGVQQSFTTCLKENWKECKS